MRRYLFFVIMGMVCATGAVSQNQQKFIAESGSDYNKIHLSFNLPSGNCYVSSKPGAGPLTLYSNVNLDNFRHEFEKAVVYNTYYINIDMDPRESDSYSESISYKLFGNKENDRKNIWKMYLSDDKPYDLRFNFGVGDAFLDLSGLSVSNLFLHTGSANVNMDYITGEGNLAVMDTFNVKVDLGSINIRRMDLCQAKYVKADVGFGDLHLDYSEGSKVGSKVKASVGAGDLVVVVPSLKTPVIVKVNNSLLCRVRLNKDFKEIRDNVYVNSEYHPNAENLLSFDVDVSMGNIIFKVK